MITIKIACVQVNTTSLPNKEAVSGVFVLTLEPSCTLRIVQERRTEQPHISLSGSDG